MPIVVPNPSPNPNQGRGVPIVVRKTAPLRNETAADFYLRDPRQVVRFRVRVRVRP